MLKMWPWLRHNDILPVFDAQKNPAKEQGFHIKSIFFEFTRRSLQNRLQFPGLCRNRFWLCKFLILLPHQ